MSTQMLLPDGIERLAITKWQNGHENFVHEFKENSSFKLNIPHSQQPYQDTTKNFQWLIKYAIDNKIQLRALGNGWSFSQVAVCEGGLVDTKALRLSYNLKDSFVTHEYLQNGKQSGDLFFTECGMSILDVDEKLEQDSDPKRSLKASGASNGQSIAGCCSTGTHGSAFNVGAVHDTVVGLHIVVSPDRHVWLEKKSNPVASDEFIEWLGAEPIKDDDIFNSALVSFGSFGFIHGMLIETEPVFLLEQFRTGNIVYNDALKLAMNNLDFSEILNVLPSPPDAPDKKLYHFEVIVNPQQFEPGNPAKGVYIRTIYKMPHRDRYTKIQRDGSGFTYGDDLLGVLETVIDGLGSNLSALLVPPLVNKLFPLAFAATDSITGTVGEMFSNTKFRGKVGSTAIGIHTSNASTVIEEVVSLSKQHPYPGGIALRFVKGTEAILGFTRFNKTCVLELDGIDSDLTKTFYGKIWERLEELNIPYTLHWGKMNFNLNTALIKKMYSDESIGKWKASRKALLDADAQKVFTNGFMTQCGLAD